MKLKLLNIENITLDNKQFKQIQQMMAYQIYLQYVKIISYTFDKEYSRTNGK